MHIPGQSIYSYCSLTNKTLTSWFKNNAESSLIRIFVLLIAVSFVVMISETVEDYVGQLFGLSDKQAILTFLGIIMGGILLTLQAVIANKRAVALEKTANAQANATKQQAKANQNTEQGQRQERLKNAIEHLGHQEVSVRLGGAYELYHLAEDTEHLRQTVLDILSAHIRQTTSQSKYREVYKSKPSEEIQSLLNLLFVQNHEVFKVRVLGSSGDTILNSGVEFSSSGDTILNSGIQPICQGWQGLFYLGILTT